MGSLREFEKRGGGNAIVFLGLLLLQILMIHGCSKDAAQLEAVRIKPPLKRYKITARLDNKQSGTSSEAKGLLSGTYSEKTKVLDYSIEFSGLTPRTIKIKKGARGTIGIVVYEIPKDSLHVYRSGQKGQKTLTALQERDLTKGNWFIVIGTDKYPEQEIRGQITLKSE